MAYDSYKMTQNTTTLTPQNKMLYDKSKQVEYLYDLAMDRENGCLLNNKDFTQSPRIFDRKEKNTFLQTIEVEVINKLDYFNSGDILHFDNNDWICITSYIFHSLYCRGVFWRCNYQIKFQNAKGDIFTYPAVFEKISSIGLDENKVINTNTKDYKVKIKLDAETKLLKQDKRFLCDIDTDKPTAYKTTGRDVLSGNINNSGLLELTITADERKDSTIDRTDLMIADYFIPKEEPHQSGISFYSVLKSSSTNNTLTIGSKSGRTVSVVMYDNETTINTTVVPVWNIEYPVGFDNQITKTDVNANKIKLVVSDNMKLINKEVKISASDGNGSYLSDVLTMKIVAGI